MGGLSQYNDAVQAIKLAILRSQYQAAKSTNATQLALYYAVGGFVSRNTREGMWGTGAIDAISEQLQKELPGLRGFSARNLKYMRTFFEEWSTVFNGSVDVSALASAEIEPDLLLRQIRHLQVPNCSTPVPEEFFCIGFTHHRTILEMAKTIEERVYYIKLCAVEHHSVDALKAAIRKNDYQHRGKIANNFLDTIPTHAQALRAISVFKDEYLLDFINVEELGVRDEIDVDERVLEQGIVHNIKNFIMEFGHDFAFVGNQYHLDAFGEDQYIDLLFFNRGLNCLVAVELKSGPFKTSYLGQLSGYLSILDGFVKKEHEENAIGIVLCKDVNKAFADFVVRDYENPMGVATYKTSKDMSEELLRALPPIEELESLLEGGDA